MEFYLRLSKHTRDLGVVFSQSELMIRLKRGLHADIRSMLRTVRKSFTGPNALSDFAEQAAAISATHETITATSRHIRERALLVEDDPHVRQPPTETVGTGRADHVRRTRRQRLTPSTNGDSHCRILLRITVVDILQGKKRTSRPTPLPREYVLE